MSTPSTDPTQTLAFVDVETTGTDPDRHEIWEVAVVVRGHINPGLDGPWSWVVQPQHLETADPAALPVGRYYTRGRLQLQLAEWPGAAVMTAPYVPTLAQQPGPEHSDPLGFPTLKRLALHLATLLEGAVLVGNNTAFDAAFLRAFLIEQGQVAAWHHRPVDVIAMAAGCQGLPVPWSSEQVSRGCGVEPPEGPLRHVALADARWAERLFDVVSVGHHEHPAPVTA